LISERSVPQMAGEDARRKVEKWRAVAVEAIKQCGAPWLPILEVPLTLQAWWARGERSGLDLLASLQPGSRHPREYFRAYHLEHGAAPSSVAVWVGPEGDFTPAELGAIRSEGALPITLGPVVLYHESRVGDVRRNLDVRNAVQDYPYSNFGGTDVTFRTDAREEAEVPLKLEKYKAYKPLWK
jgi:RsmE family RNA methyltransferase